MNTKELFVVLKPSPATDSAGGDLPWQDYLMVSGNGRGITTDLTLAVIYTRKQEAEAARSKCREPYMRVETLEEAIKHAMHAAYDHASWELDRSS
jgi:hypothetical protein